MSLLIYRVYQLYNCKMIIIEYLYLLSIYKVVSSNLAHNGTIYFTVFLAIAYMYKDHNVIVSSYYVALKK